MDCKYCRIAARQFPAHILYEDQHVVAFLAENSVSKGHCLVIPKQHAESYTQIKDIAGFATGLKNFLNLMEKKMSTDMHLIANLGKKAGQDINHFYIHVIPRYEGEKIFEWTWHQLTRKEAEEVKRKIKWE
jgi:histidine triad (HIT) family protein